jgi:beta-galactosidase
VKVRTTPQPGVIVEACGVSYTQFTIPKGVSVTSPYAVQKGNDTARYWMELLTPARYDHPVWGQYAALTENTYGKGLATYLGFMPSEELLGKILEDAVRKAGLWGADQDLAFPLITKSGVNPQGKVVRYYFNYSVRAATFKYPHKAGKDLLSTQAVPKDSQQQLAPWGVMIVRED